MTTTKDAAASTQDAAGERDTLTCDDCGDVLRLEDIVGHLAAEGRAIPAAPSVRHETEDGLRMAAERVVRESAFGKGDYPVTYPSESALIALRAALSEERA